MSAKGVSDSAKLRWHFAMTLNTAEKQHYIDKNDWAVSW